jgi:hypothetical protein
MPANPYATPSAGITMPGVSGPPAPPGAGAPYLPPAPAPPPKNNTPLIIGLVVGVLALCMLGTVGVVVGGIFFLNNKRTPGTHALAPDDRPSSTANTYPPLPTQATTPALPPAPVTVGQCISVDEQGDYLGIGNCNGTSGTYRVLSVDSSQGSCADPQSPFITVDGYRLCLELYLVRTYCYKFPQGNGWIVGATACKAKGTVVVVDIVPNASNGNNCTRDYQWNRWYRFTHPTVVYCVMQY